MAIAKKHFKKSSQQGSDDGIRLEGRPHRVIIISANMSARPPMNSREVRWLNHAMPFAMVFAIIAVFAVKLRWNPCAPAARPYGVLRMMSFRPLLRCTRSRSMTLTR